MSALADKVLVLGVDGMDPRLTRKYVDEGILPNIAEYMARGACRKDLVMLGAMPTITPPMWTTLATGAYAATHGITCFWNQDHAHLDTMVYSLDSRLCKAEPVWNVLAGAGKKTLVWHWPGSSWPPTMDSDYLHVVDGAQPSNIGNGYAKVETEKITVAKESLTEVKYVPAAASDTGAGCIIDDLPEQDDVFDSGLISNGKTVQNLILTHEDGELALDKVPFDVGNSPIRPAVGWANAPEGAKEFFILTSDGLIRRPALILPNAQGVYDRVAIYHGKQSMEPLVVMHLGEYVDLYLDEYLLHDKVVRGSRGGRIVELAPDGSYLLLWLSRCLDADRDDMWQPKALYREVVDNVGYPRSAALVGGKNTELIRLGVLPCWDAYTAWQAQALLYLIKSHEYDVVFSHCHNVDAMGHMFWYFGKDREKLGNDESVYHQFMRETYEQTDRYLGAFLPLLDEGWTIFIVSDHGLLCTPEDEQPLIGDAFGCNVRVMEELGFTVLKRDADGCELREIDWTRTRAVATRAGHIWINLKGREQAGIVEPGDKYALEREIIDGLYGYRLGGRRVIALALRNKDALIVGMSGPECGDIVYFLEEGFNRVHGDALSTQEGYGETSVSPIFIAAGRGIKPGFVTERVIRQVDVAPTVAMLLDVAMPAQCEGAPVYQIIGR